LRKFGKFEQVWASLGKFEHVLVAMAIWRLDGQLTDETDLNSDAWSR
jgi:hypothetical protein